MPDWLTPRKRTAQELVWLQTLVVDIDSGTVFNSKGKAIGHMHPYGYIYIGAYINGVTKPFKRAHIVWWAATGNWPIKLIDHKDRNRANDSFSNLREATPQENCLNSERVIRSRSTPKTPNRPKKLKDAKVLKAPKKPKIFSIPNGPLEIYYNRSLKKFQAGVSIQGKLKQLGRFLTYEEAVQAIELWVTKESMEE